jgi:ribosomal protein S18 acetylase RimI-like enzyme
MEKEIKPVTLYPKDLEDFLDVARSTDAFQSEEIEVLREVLEEYIKNPGQDYIILTQMVDDFLVGFVVFGRVSLTKSSWDIYWLVVHRDFQRRGIGSVLLKKVEEFVGKDAILRVETSGKEEYRGTREFYLKNGFKEVGRIPHFYGQDDPLIIFSKVVSS